jgi:hypothetical protein
MAICESQATNRKEEGFLSCKLVVPTSHLQRARDHEVNAQTAWCDEGRLGATRNTQNSIKVRCRLLLFDWKTATLLLLKKCIYH